MDKHAYLIMAHHRFEILKELLADLDQNYNDIFLHIDKKSKNFDEEDIKSVIKNARIYFVERMSIRWGGFSQIKCILNLLEKATSTGEHQYYHFMVGVEFPIKTPGYIYKFFNENHGYEFIGFDEYDTKFHERVKYKHFFNEYARNNNIYQKILNKIRIILVCLQKLLKVDVAKKYGLTLKKGNANWSITHELASYIVQQKKQIYKMYKHSFCGDEVFIHTIIYNTHFYDKVYDKKDEFRSCMRLSNWTNSNNQYHMSDLEELLASERFFARKIDGDDAIQLITEIKKHRR